MKKQAVLVLLLGLVTTTQAQDFDRWGFRVKGLPCELEEIVSTRAVKTASCFTMIESPVEDYSVGYSVNVNDLRGALPQDYGSPLRLALDLVEQTAMELEAEGHEVFKERFRNYPSLKVYVKDFKDGEYQYALTRVVYVGPIQINITATAGAKENQIALIRTTSNYRLLEEGFQLLDGQ